MTIDQIREKLLAEVQALDALVGTCEHDLHKSLVWCPYCKRDARLASLMRAAAASLRSEGAPPAGWQPIETAPKDDEVLIWQPNWPRCVVASQGTVARGKAGRWFQRGDGETSRPTHWMPLPAPPNMERSAPAGGTPPAQEGTR